ncbi:MAG: calcium/proton exchanger [Candidatus Poseidoniales archaeon]|uniref:calcium/proton exchanger n=1 Tax=Candidatus Thalassarchaeum betae TaxID=2599289 RepID=UPI00100304C4|nr:calcium/proton exchanger [Candidatus Thalassoarchaea betae]RTZ93630.1 MAG: calcium/proton exchanger [Candidatus Poseidoniales archaeon]
MGEGEVNWMRAMDPRQSKLNLMLLAIPATFYFAYVSGDQTAAFFASMVAIMPLAFLMGFATEEIALRTSDSIGGLLNATFGNAAELIIATFAIWAAYQAGAGSETADVMVHIVQASLIGSILGNLLLVMGLAFVWGGIHHKVQTFNETQFVANSSLLLLAVITLVVPTVYHLTVGGEEGNAGVANLSRAAALVLLGMYVLFLLFQLRTHSDLFATDGINDEEPQMSKRDAVVLLLVATVFVSWMAEILVHSLETAANEVGLSYLFIGVILLPLFGNAAEHFTAVTVAGKDKMDLSFAIAIGSSTQIAVFVAPLMVVFAWMLGVGLTFEFGILETVAAFLAVMIVNAIAADGKSNWLEGAMLLGAYTVLALAFWFHP